jgi:3-oxochol-4-en-24-oyl-CoA dehydrogenase
VPIATTGEQLALRDAIRAWAADTHPARLTRAREPGLQPETAPSGSPGAGGSQGAGGPQDAGCWADLAGLGIFSIAVPEAAGGAGGTAADVATALEELTRAMVPGPVMPTVLGSLLLAAPPGAASGAGGPGQAPGQLGGPSQAGGAGQAGGPGQPDAPSYAGGQAPGQLGGLSQAGGAGQARGAGPAGGRDLLPALAAGQASVAVALGPGGLHGTWLAGGALWVSGDTGLILGAGGTSHLILAAAVPGAPGPGMDGPGAGPGGAPAAATGPVGNGAGSPGTTVWFLVPAAQPGVTVVPHAPVDFSRPLAGVSLRDCVIPPGQILGGLETGRVRDLAATLFAAEAAAVAGWCCDTAAAYARTRHQFGRPIGSFQAVKHLCAGMLGRSERAAALAWDAARAADGTPDEHPLAAAAAAALALDAAVDNAKDCIQVLGGIGFTWEHDAHLYLRRALALRQLLGGGAAWGGRIGGGWFFRAGRPGAAARRRWCWPERGAASSWTRPH